MKLQVSSIVEKGAEIGENTILGYFCHVHSETLIGNDCVIGDHVVFTDTSTRSNISKRKFDDSKTIVGNGVKIGSHCTIMGNTQIGDGAIISDGSVVISRVFPFTFVAGNPARIIYSLSSLRK